MVGKPDRPTDRHGPRDRATPGRRSNNPRDPVALLFAMNRSLRLEETPLAATAARIAAKNDQKPAAKLAKRLASAYYPQQLNPNHFLSLETGLDGDFLLGQTNGGQRLGLTRDEMNRHVFISGQSGVGKSTLIDNLFRRGRELGIHCVHFDRKGDLEHRVREGVESYSWPHLRINPLCPPSTRVNIHEYRNDFVKAFCELNQFMQRGTSLFMRGVDELYRAFRVYERWPSWEWGAQPFPTLADLLALFRGKEFAACVRGHGRESLFSIIDKLESLIIQLGPIVSCERGVDVKRFYFEHRAFNYNLDGLAVECQNFLIVSELLRYTHLFRAHGPRNELNTLLFFDESKGLLGGKHEVFIIKDLVSKVREYGIGLVCADQIPSEINQFFFSNVGTLIMFRHSDGRDLQRVRYSSGATFEQSLENYSLQPGEAIVRSMRCRDLHRVRVPYSRVEKFIPRDEVERLMTPRLRDFHQEVIAASRRKQPVKQAVAELGELDRRFLSCAVRLIDQPSSTIYEALGLTSSAGHRIKQRLLTQLRLSEVVSNLGVGGRRMKHLVPSPDILERLGLAFSDGRGGALHKHFQRLFRDRARALGYRAEIEEGCGTPEAADIGVQRHGCRTAIEISITSKARTEARNIEKNLRLGYDSVILAFVNKRALEKTREVASASVRAAALTKTRFLMISDAFRALEEER